MKYYYFCTKGFYFFENQIKKLKSEFEINPIYIDEIKDIYKHKKNGHHFDGVTHKIEILIDVIKENIGSRIIFSDVTFFINDNKTNEIYNEFINNKYDDYDQIFMEELTGSKDDIVNFGLIIINCKDDIICFYEDIIKQIKESGKHDQKILNLNIQKTKYTTLDSKKFYGYGIFKEQYKNTYCMFKPFCNRINKIDDWNYKLKVLLNGNLINNEDYINNIIN
jgi:hypothetical protein